ncbi:glutamyl-tRNA(Gln) amidotransferase subunit C, mitochondrial isoform X2 [Scyliorhinus torazame]|uniref:glutamyl-tRNA(Gln) amidotransferase subunit C, mitochondrial isoform X2 n=1 Tax=Scyliorhinus torazame TaxID=75743 RepID=UPI003B5BB176
MWSFTRRAAQSVPLLGWLRPNRAVNPRVAVWGRQTGGVGVEESGPGPGPRPGRSKVSMEMIDHLERLALVDFRNQEGVERLADAIQFANQLHVVDTEGVEPMDSVLEDRSLYLRADKVTEGYCTEVILSNAKHVIEEYLVAPPGNIPLPKKEERDSFLQHSN